MSDLEITKKFNMLSTKEWQNYFQQKLAPERERELEEQAQIDPFLNEALKSLSNTDIRPIAYQSFNSLINQINSATGIAESNVMSSRHESQKSDVSFNFKKIALILGVILVLAAIGYGIYYLIMNQSLSSEGDNNTEIIEAESTDLEMENKPFDQLPESDNVSTLDTISTTTVKPKTTQSKPTQTNETDDLIDNSHTFNNTNNNVATPTVTKPTTSSTPSNPPPKVEYNKDQFKAEKDKFDRAQDLYRQGKMEESKKILLELKSYDNPMKSKSEEILKNIDN